MGNQCCTGRDHIYKRKAQENDYDKFLNGSTSKFNGNYFSFGHADDVVRFDRAYDNNDIKEFVLLCKSNCQIEKLNEKMHPWAAEPETIGALAATQLAILASKEGEETAAIKDEIRVVGGIEVLVDLLKSTEEDRLHAAVVALSFLSVENIENCEEMYKQGALEHLVKGMKCNIDGMRAACAQTARNIYVLDVEYRRAFVKAGGLAQLVKLLDLPSEVRSDNNNLTEDQCLFTQLEATYHIEDLILHDSEELSEFMSLVKNAGAVNKLRILAESTDTDLAEAAGALVVRLAD